MRPLALRGPRDTCGPDCDRFIAKWEAWWDSAFSETNRPAMLETPHSRSMYLDLIGAKSRNMLVKAGRAGFIFDDFDHDVYLNELHEINRSMPVRSGGPMRPAYMQRPPAIGRTPQLCKRHRHHWIGAFAPGQPADEPTQLLAYTHLVVVNELAVINTILAHRDALQHAVMNALVAEIARRATSDGTIRYTNYLTLNCPAGLARFKRSVGFRETPIGRRRITLDTMDTKYLTQLVTERDAATEEASCRDAYLQGRIDEYCAQNAIDAADTNLDLKLGEMDDA